MYYYKIKVIKKAGATAPFTLTIDGAQIVSLRPEDIPDGGVIITFASYRPARFINFPQGTHTLSTGFMDDSSPAYSIMGFYLSRKWLSYTPRIDCGQYDVIFLDYAFLNVVGIESAS